MPKGVRSSCRITILYIEQGYLGETGVSSGKTVKKVAKLNITLAVESVFKFRQIQTYSDISTPMV